MYILHSASHASQLLLDGDVGLTAAPLRALTRAFLGSSSGPGLTTTGCYTQLQDIRLWKCPIGEDGTIALAELLVDGAVPLTYLELLDCHVGPRGCHALGQALSDASLWPSGGAGQQKAAGKSSLLTLKLSYNPHISTAGIVALCAGLRTNQTLRQLHVDYCRLRGLEAGRALSQFVCMPKNQLGTLSLKGNSIEDGLTCLATGIRRSPNLTCVDLSDNALATSDRHAMLACRDMLLHNPRLVDLDLNYNALPLAAAELLLPALEANVSLTRFSVDASLPPELFQKLNRVETKKAGKKGKKGKKKGKK